MWVASALFAERGGQAGGDAGGFGAELLFFTWRGRRGFGFAPIRLGRIRPRRILLRGLLLRRFQVRRLRFQVRLARLQVRASTASDASSSGSG